MEHLLEVKDVTKIYEGGVLANHNVRSPCPAWGERRR